MKIHSLIILFSVLLLVVSNCKTKKVTTEQKPSTEVSTESQQNTNIQQEEPIEEVVELSEEEKAELSILYYSQTPCFGKCPEFEFNVFENGMAFYKGKKNVDKIGTYTAKVEIKEVYLLLQFASENGFFHFKNANEQESVTDLPSTITQLNYYGKQNKVICTIDCSKELLKLNQKIESFMETIEWKKFD